MNARDRYINHTYSQSRDRGRAEYAAQDLSDTELTVEAAQRTIRRFAY
ncbi:hypothetical protein [Mycobacteroides abscessus]|nr:hypothetical protein [Mycobacteroides abscessus]